MNLKLFPTTLKEVSLPRFMGIGGNSIRTWDELRHKLLNKYHEYCKVRDIKEENFKMTQRYKEIIEYYIERFQYNL
jgi:hypothetical protein